VVEKNLVESQIQQIRNLVEICWRRNQGGCHVQYIAKGEDSSSCSDFVQYSLKYRRQNDNATSLLKNVFVAADEEMERQLLGVSSGQPQLFAKIARSRDLHPIPEQLLPCFFSPVLGGHVVSVFG
jgi:hypothetical protein